MKVYDLMLEITRKCNMKCAHCLRGTATSQMMDPNIIHKAFRMFDDIGVLTLTGGEPTTAIKLLEYVGNFMQWHHKSLHVDSFFMVTNGKLLTPRIKKALETIIRNCKSNEITNISISMDEYHDTPDAYHKWLEWGEYMTERYNLNEYFISDKPLHGILNMGRGWGTDVRGTSPSIEDDDYIDGLLYINAKGDLIPCCDLSFKAQEYYKMGNLMNLDTIGVLSAIKNYVQPHHYENI